MLSGPQCNNNAAMAKAKTIAAAPPQGRLATDKVKQLTCRKAELRIYEGDGIILCGAAKQHSDVSGAIIGCVAVHDLAIKELRSQLPLAKRPWGRSLTCR